MHKLLFVLFICTLGVHAQTDKLTFMSYNLMYYRASNGPCTPSQGPSVRDQELTTIFHFIKPTIFTVNELGAGSSIANLVLNNVINTNGIQSYDKALSTNHPLNQSSIVNLLFFDSTKVGLHSQEYLDKELDGTTRIVRVIDFYRMYYKDPKLKLGGDTTFFTVIVGHLKASSGTANKAERGETAKAIMKHLTDNVSDENVILCGDMNFYTNSEQGFQQFTNYSVASERLNDPINQIGSWSNNSTYAPYHTQSTHLSASGCHVGGGLDDRFDFFFISNALQNGADGMTYKLNSQKVLGNDGNHFNQDINAGTNNSAPASIISALYNFSDHLPIVMEVEVNQSDLSLSTNVLEKITYTNPVVDICHLKSLLPSGNKTVTLLNITGSLISTNTWESEQNEYSFPMTHVPTGLYILSITDTNGGAVSKKIIKK